MHVGAGVVLAIVGIAVLMVPARFIRAEQQSYGKIAGQMRGRVLARSGFVVVGCHLVLAGVLLALAVRTG